MSILVVDDNEDIRQLLRWLLVQAGLEAVVAASGPEALALLGGSTLPELVILDVQMPDMDGWETLRAIRANPRTAGLAVILCTVKGRHADAARGWELGCDGYVTKPFDVDALLRHVETVLSRTEDERSRARRAALADVRRLAAVMG